MQTIETHYLSPTDTKGSRIAATTESGERLVTNCDSSLNIEEDHARAAKRLKKKLHWQRHIIGGTTQKGFAWVFIHNSPQI